MTANWQLRRRFAATGLDVGFTEELTQWSADHSCPRIVCEVNVVPPNPGSLAFHKTLGFSKVGQLSVHDGREVVLLEYSPNGGAWKRPDTHG